MNSAPHRPAEESRPKVAQARRLAQSREDNRQAGPLPQTASDAKALPSSRKVGRKRKKGSDVWDVLSWLEELF